MVTTEPEKHFVNVPVPNALSSTNPLSQKLSHVLSNSFIDSEISSGLAILEQEGFVNDADSRRELSPKITLQELSIKKSVLDDYQRLVRELHQIKMGIDSMQATCQQMRIQANSIKGSTSQLLEQATFLQQQKRKAHEKHDVLRAFRSHFMIEETALRTLSSAEPVNEQFFDCLDQVSAIHERCSGLLVVDTQIAGLEIMETMTRHLESGYSKLHLWILKELKATSAGATEANVLLRRALTKLAQRSDLYERTLDHVSDSRRRVVAADFDQARTRGRLESNRDDAITYVGDLLAWLHQAIASEREILELILGSPGRDKSRLNVGSHNENEEILNYRTVQNELIDRNFSLVMTVLQRQVDQVISAQNDRIGSFKAALLIRFYRNLVDRVLEEDAAVIRSLRSMEQTAISKSMQSTRNMVAALNVNPPEVDELTLELPSFLKYTIEDLVAVLVILEESFLDSEEKATELTEVWDQLLRQCIEVCVRSSSEIPQPASSIHLLNCMTALERALGSVTFTTKQLSMCQSAAERCRQALILEQHDYLLRHSGIITQYEALDENIGDTPISRLPEFQIETLKDLASQVQKFVPTATQQLQHRLARVNNREYAAQINAEAVSRFVRDYTKVEDAVMENIEFGRSLLTLTNSDVRRSLALPEL